MPAAIARRSDGRFVSGGGGGGGAVTRTRVIRVPAGAQRVARRVGGAAARAAWDEKHTLVALAAAGALGYAQKENMELPHIEAIGMPATYAAAAFLGARMFKSKTLAHVATGLACVAVNDYVRGTGGTPRTRGAVLGGSIDGDY